MHPFKRRDIIKMGWIKFCTIIMVISAAGIVATVAVLAFGPQRPNSLPTVSSPVSGEAIVYSEAEQKLLEMVRLDVHKQHEDDLFRILRADVANHGGVAFRQPTRNTVPTMRIIVPGSYLERIAPLLESSSSWINPNYQEWAQSVAVDTPPAPAFGPSTELRLAINGRLFPNQVLLWSAMSSTLLFIMGLLLRIYFTEKI